METSRVVPAACPSTHRRFRPFGDWHVPCSCGSQFGAAPDAPLHRVKDMVNMNTLQKFIVWAGVVGGVAGAAPVGAAPISFVSGAGVAWTSDNDVVCGGPAACGGSTVAITPHGAWQGNNPDGSAPCGPPTPTPGSGSPGPRQPARQRSADEPRRSTWTARQARRSASKVWADDTAASGSTACRRRRPTSRSRTCANGVIGCQPREFGLFSWTADRQRRRAASTSTRSRPRRRRRSHRRFALFSTAGLPDTSRVENCQSVIGSVAAPTIS